MPQRSWHCTKHRSTTGKEVFKFFDRDQNQLDISFEDLVFVDGLLIHQSQYALSHDGGVIMKIDIKAGPDRFQAVKLKETKS